MMDAVTHLALMADLLCDAATADRNAKRLQDWSDSIDQLEADIADYKRRLHKTSATLERLDAYLNGRKL